MNVSVIICTLNRAESLEATVRSFGQVAIPHSVKPEILVVDNGSTDGSLERARSLNVKGFASQVISEPRKGKSRALNLGLARAGGDLLVFTDDDVRPSPDWLTRICGRLTDGSCEALIGTVRLPPFLERGWMTRRLRVMLANEGLEDSWCKEMIGANMAFHRRILDRVPGFDVELGPASLGTCEETLFSWQVCEAGFRIKRAPDVVVEHHCDLSRLLRTSFVNRARDFGRSWSYLTHHWKHEVVRFPRMRMVLAGVKLARRRVVSRADTRMVEGCSEWELLLTQEFWQHKHYLVERLRPRNYALRGLAKLLGEPAFAKRSTTAAA